MKRNHWNKGQRMQLKALVCVLGILLLAILLVGRLLAALFSSGDRQEDEIHNPVVEELRNVWIMEADEKGLLIFRDGIEEQCPMSKASIGELPPQEKLREQIADIVLTDGAVTDVHVKTEKINGRILSADDIGVEVEGYGKIPFAKDYKGYRIYRTLEMCSGRDLLIGYNFADFVLENGEICGLLMVREDSMEAIRVLLKTSDYEGLLHERVVLSSDTDFTIQYGPSDAPCSETHTAGEEVVVDADSDYFSGDRITVIPSVLTGKVVLKNVNRSQGTPAYRGHIELFLTEEGIAVVNQVLLEEYLYSVVPSEMPASYPKEALKAQAVCARTYAYGHMLRAGYPQYGAHVDDSTSYQVYNNIPEQESATTAVKETYGRLLGQEDGTLAETFYYSTSCGVGSDANVWKTKEAQTLSYLKAKAINRDTLEQEKRGEEIPVLGELLRQEEAFAKFITAKNVRDFEVTEGWYRWVYEVKKLDAEHVCDVLMKRYQANPDLVLTLEGKEYVSKPVEPFLEVKDLFIAKRSVGGVAEELVIVTKDQTYKVITEHNIRYVLCSGESKIQRQDGSEVDAPTILPSAFFIISADREKENVVGYTLSGGGFGHGVGMSQNGARQMAQSGCTAEEILLFFYDGCMVWNIYEAG